MIGYRARLEGDLERWRRAGWITADGAGAIRAELATRTSRFGLPHVLALLGAVLLCFAAMTFVASNWQTLSKATRLAILAVGLWGSFGAAYAFFRREQEAFGQAAVLAGTGVFGAAIMLIAQMYHMDGHPPDAVLLWGLCAVLAGVALRAVPALVLSVLLLAVWSGWETGLLAGVHWGFLPAWGLLTLAALVVTRWPPLFLLLAVTLAGWIFMLAFTIPIGQGPVSSARHVLFEIPAVVGLAGAIAAWAASPWIERIVPIARPLTALMLATSFAGLWGLQFLERNTPLLPLGVWFVIALSGLVGAIAWALRTDHRPVLAVAYAGFCIELVSIYFKTLGTLLNTSLFFLSAGLLVIGLSWIALKLHNRTSAPAGGQPS